MPAARPTRANAWRPTFTHVILPFLNFRVALSVLRCISLLRRRFALTFTCTMPADQAGTTPFSDPSARSPLFSQIFHFLPSLPFCPRILPCLSLSLPLASSYIPHALLSLSLSLPSPSLSPALSLILIHTNTLTHLGTQGVYLPGYCSRRYNTVAAFLRCCFV